MTTETPKLKLETGRCYRTRDGRKARVICTDKKSDLNLHVVALVESGKVEAPFVFKFDGTTYSHQSAEDLLTEWHDLPQVDWSAMPKWAKWVAMDNGGEWFWYESKPKEGDSGWYYSVGGMDEIPRAFHPAYTGDWKLSLAERPTV